jgi:hypothetical protein
MGFLAGKRAFIVGVATDRSIAWGIAQAMLRACAGRTRRGDAPTLLNDAGRSAIDWQQRR